MPPTIVLLAAYLAFAPIAAFAYAFLWPTVSARVWLFITLGAVLGIIIAVGAVMGSDAACRHRHLSSGSRRTLRYSLVSTGATPVDWSTRRNRCDLPRPRPACALVAVPLNENRILRGSWTSRGPQEAHPCSNSRERFQSLSPSSLVATDQLHTSTLRPATLEKCLILFVTRVIPWDTACDAMRRSMFPIGLPERSNSERIRA